jgi:hypothetical protein
MTAMDWRPGNRFARRAGFVTLLIIHTLRFVAARRGE